MLQWWRWARWSGCTPPSTTQTTSSLRDTEQSASHVSGMCPLASWMLRQLCWACSGNCRACGVTADHLCLVAAHGWELRNQVTSFAPLGRAGTPASHGQEVMHVMEVCRAPNGSGPLFRCASCHLGQLRLRSVRQKQGAAVCGCGCCAMASSAQVSLPRVHVAQGSLHWVCCLLAQGDAPGLPTRGGPHPHQGVAGTVCQRRGWQGPLPDPVR